VLRHWNERALPELLAAHDLADVPEMDFQHDGWSGASLTRLARGDDAFILKRTAWSNDWIARATQDRDLREGFVATGQLPLPPSIVAPYLGAAADGPSVAMLMPDLSATLIDWERPDGQPTITSATLDRVLGAIVDLHHGPVPDVGAGPWPWCPLRERLTLLTRSAAVRLSADGQAAGARFLAGWAAFDALAPRGARDLIERLDLDPGALLDALADRPTALLHGDLKVANVALLDDGRTDGADRLADGDGRPRRGRHGLVPRLEFVGARCGSDRCPGPLCKVGRGAGPERRGRIESRCRR